MRNRHNHRHLIIILVTLAIVAIASAIFLAKARTAAAKAADRIERSEKSSRDRVEAMGVSSIEELFADSEAKEKK